MELVLLTVVGDDRPGLIEALSSVVADHGGNWERSQLARMGGKFAGIVSVEIDNANLAPLTQGLSTLGDQGLEISVEQVQSREADSLAGSRIAIDIVGPDHPGIVHEVATALAKANVTIVEFDSHLREAPMAGGLIFDADLEAVLPAGLDESALASALEEVAAGLMVEISLD